MKTEIKRIIIQDFLKLAIKLSKITEKYSIIQLSL